MANADLSHQCDIGVVGLDSSGRRLARAMAEQGLKVAAYDGNAENIKALRDEAIGTSIHIAADMTQLIGFLRQFRTILISGSDATGESLSELLEQLEAADVLIDAGNCHFKDCSRRARGLAERNIRYLDVGVIGDGKDGGCGPVLMVGGRPEIYQGVLSILESMALHEDGQPLVSHLGPASAGHFVKMIHDGIEYSLMQLVLEAFDLLKRSLNLGDEALQSLANTWQMGVLNGCQRDEAARWTSQAARELEAPIPTIDAAVGLRAFSELEKQNDFATTLFRQPLGQFDDDPESILEELRGALSAATIITYAEGMAMLAAGSEQYGFDIDLEEVIRLWQGCCGRRAALLDEMASAIQATPNLPNLLHDEDLSEKVMEQQERLRHAVWRAGPLQTAVPALMASLDYLDSCRGAWMPINLMQIPPKPRRPAALVLH